MVCGYTTEIRSGFEYFPSLKAPFTSPDFQQAPAYYVIIKFSKRVVQVRL